MKLFIQQEFCNIPIGNDCVIGFKGMYVLIVSNKVYAGSYINKISEFSITEVSPDFITSNPSIYKQL